MAYKLNEIDKAHAGNEAKVDEEVLKLDGAQAVNGIQRLSVSSSRKKYGVDIRNIEQQTVSPKTLATN